MLTPFTDDDRVDLETLDGYVDWLIAQGAVSPRLRGLRVFNAGIGDHIDVLGVGAAGLSGWVANVAPDLVAELGGRVGREPADGDARGLQQLLVEVERRMEPTYPGSAKAIVEARAGIGFRTHSRWRPAQVDARVVAEIVDLIASAR